ncbi:MAG: hypothetical protein EI684_08440 [Candidatus Viridilinea halotolerans]|uniref:Cas10/Cmr2 second palm domain-containing protein n=1 Tax=Candidatus Viridilinea halotolerans TaxID=2491704 RepID=A0A426U299_9CHLR|nr:MAG: hypothetical protein EI684_08440 [Candidatus Viridilinea halotolerans]
MTFSVLLAAEADKIQDFVFRAARLRQVTGGSALLTRFCQQVPQECLGLANEQIVVNDGGAFRLLFADEATAHAAGCELADLYYMATGCNLSVAAPVTIKAHETFGAANERAGLLLRAAKLNHAPQAVAHLPYLAFCASTGVELAFDYGVARGGGQKQYLSLASSYKRREAGDDGKEAFIKKFIEDVVGAEGRPEVCRVPDDPDLFGRAGGYDPRDYVAYLVADGNGIGALFGRCQSSEHAHALSCELGRITRQCLATATQCLMKVDPGKQPDLVPVLPLILGGDDLVALLPASYALAVAQKFCHEFEQAMANSIATIPELVAAPKPTMAAAVVICKAKYPFQLAIQQGQELLKEAKRLSKQGAKQRSAVNFAVIVGNRLADPDAARNSPKLRPTLRPYWVGADATREAIPLQWLLEARFQLRALPQKRQAELLAHFERTDFREMVWHNDLQAIVERIISLAPNKSRELETALEQLGCGEKSANDEAHYRRIYRATTSFQGSALPEVLTAWDFLYDLARPRSEYEVEHA